MSIGTSTSTGPGPSGLREMERALHDARQIVDAVDAVDALAERPVDLALVGVLVEVDLLVRVAAEVVRRHVAGDHDHRDRIERRVGDAGARVGQPRTEVRQQHAGLAGRARVAVGGVGRHLFVARRDEPDAALPERVEQRDDRVPAQAEDHLDAEALEILGQQVRGDPGLASPSAVRSMVWGATVLIRSSHVMVRRFRCRRTRRTTPAPTGDLRQSAG